MNVIIIGGGDIGYQLAKRLSSEKHNITLIERDSIVAKHAEEHLDCLIIEGDATNYNILKKAGVHDTDIFIALSNVDETNILSCQIAKKSGVKATIARVRNEDFLSEDYILSKQELGVDLFIHPEMETAQVIIRLIRQSNATDIIEFDDGKLRLLGIRLEKNCQVLNTPLQDIGTNLNEIGIRIVAIKRGNFTIIPKGEDLLIVSDQIFIICTPARQEEVLEYFGKSKSAVENVMIIGGGQIGKFISRELENDIKIKIIEVDATKSHNLADSLSKALVINGDGSDLDLLTFESLTSMDEFIAVTGDDETNIITSIIAKHLEVPRTITLVRKIDYLPLTPAIGMDAVVNKQQITVNAIQRFIRRRRVAHFAEIPTVDAEIIEFIAKKSSKITKKELRSVKFPEGAIVGAILKNNKKIEIPTGASCIEENDRVIVFSLPRAINDLEKLFV